MAKRQQQKKTNNKAVVSSDGKLSSVDEKKQQQNEDEIEVTFENERSELEEEHEGITNAFDSSDAEEEEQNQEEDDDNDTLKVGSDDDEMEQDHFELGSEHIEIDEKTLTKFQEKLKSHTEYSKSLSSSDNQKDEKTGVVYLGRIPHGFYEKEMKAYFSQFGQVTRLRLSRNKKTGRSKHFAFIEFSSASVAKIVAETMNNYLLFGHLLKCEYVPAERLHPNTFNGANKSFKAIPWNKIERKRHNKKRAVDEKSKILKRLIQKETIKRKKIADMGIDYDFPGYKACL